MSSLQFLSWSLADLNNVALWKKANVALFSNFSARWHPRLKFIIGTYTGDRACGVRPHVQGTNSGDPRNILANRTFIAQVGVFFSFSFVRESVQGLSSRMDPRIIDLTGSDKVEKDLMR